MARVAISILSGLLASLVITVVLFFVLMWLVMKSMGSGNNLFSIYLFGFAALTGTFTVGVGLGIFVGIWTFAALSRPKTTEDKT